MNLLAPGKKAPNFKLKDRNGKEHTLSDFKDKYVVLFFYPKDNTPGCTIEAKGFSKTRRKFSELGTEVIGISGGDEKSKTKFCTKNSLRTLMLSDPDFAVAKKFGAYGEKSFMGVRFKGIHRVSYLIDPKGRIKHVFEKVNPLKHPGEVLNLLESLR